MFELKEIIFSVTSRCNLKCIMCDIPSSRAEELSTGILFSALEDAAALGAGTAVFSGGEPLLREDIFDLMAFARKLGMNACLTSNGCLIDEITAGRLADSGAGVVNISVEGDRTVHERLRGPGTYDKAVRALRFLRSRGVETTIASTVSRYNYSSLEHIVDLAKDTGATTLKFQPFSRIFVTPGRNCSEFLLGEVEARAAMDIMHSIHALCGHHGISVNPLPYMERIPSYLSKGIGGNASTCRAIFSSCPVSSSGKVFPCWVLSGKEMLIGDIARTPLRKIWGSDRHKDIIDRIGSRSCGGCLMSCYDANFSRSLFSPAAGPSRKIISSGPGKILRKFGRKARFYLAYRGSPLRLLRRLRPARHRRGRAGSMSPGRKIREIENAQEMVEKELRSLR